jgi:uncharacterized membrane protein
MQPPQNPYNQPNFGQPQQPFNPQQPFAPPPQQPRGTVSLDVIGEAWKLVQPSLGQWVLAIFVVGALSFAVNFVMGLLQLPFAPAKGQNPSGMFYLIQLVAQIVSFVVQTATAGALIKMAIAQTRTGIANISDMFSVTDVLGPLMVGAILTSLVTVGGLVLLIIPGIIAALGLAMTQPLIVDQKMTPVDAMKRSWEVMKPNLGSFFVLGLVLGLLNFAGVLACCVGLFITYPISTVAIALVYRDLFGIMGTPAAPGNYTPPPIANPNF